MDDNCSPRCKRDSNGSRETTFWFLGNDFPGLPGLTLPVPGKTTSRFQENDPGGRWRQFEHGDTRVIKVADFKSEVIWPPWSFGGRHGLRYIYLGNWGHRASHAYFSSPLAPLIYRAIALLLTPYVYALSVSSGEPLRSKLLKNENQRR